MTSALALARAIRDGSLTATEAVEAALARSAAVQPRLNPFAEIRAEAALSAAAAVDRARSKGRPLGPLAGVPVAIKDLTPIAGWRTTCGSAALAGHVAERSAVIVQRLQAAGAVIVAKTATPEFAHSSFTESPLLGITRNPWDPARTPGGSSGGSAVAVATGCVALAEGTDMGGSIRIPAALSGCVGLKPSLGRIPVDILPTTFDTLSHFGPLARSVPDAALFLSVTQGPDDADILSLPHGPPIDPEKLAHPRGRRIALSIDLGFYDVHPAVAANTRGAAEALRDAGCVVEDVDLPWTRALVDLWTTHWSVFLAADFGHHRTAHRDRMDPALVALMDAGDRVSAVDLRRLDHLRSRQWESLAALFGRFDALLCPTMALPAPPVGVGDAVFAADSPDGRFLGLDMTAVFNNVAPCPSLSVPSGFADGLPTGAQIVGRRHDDRGVLEIGAALERALGLDMTPPA